MAPIQKLHTALFEQGTELEGAKLFVEEGGLGEGLGSVFESLVSNSELTLAAIELIRSAAFFLLVFSSSIFPSRGIPSNVS